MLWDAIGDDKSVNSTDTAETMLAMLLNVYVVNTSTPCSKNCSLAQSDAKSLSLQIEQLQSSALCLSTTTESELPHSDSHLK